MISMRFRGFGQGYYIVFQFAGRIVTDAGHKTDLMIDENERGILGSQRFVRTHLIIHCILLCGDTGFSHLSERSLYLLYVPFYNKASLVSIEFTLRSVKLSST